MRLIDLISKYIRELKRERFHTLRTIISYESDLKKFAQFAGESRAPNDISVHLIERYFRNITEIQQLTDVTISRKLCSVRSFFRYLEYEELITRSPMSRFPFKVTIRRNSPIFISPKEISKLFYAILKENKALRKKLAAHRSRGDSDRLIEYQLFCNTRNNLFFRLALETGIRPGELTKTKNDQVHLHRKSGTICTTRNDQNYRHHYIITNSDTLKMTKYYKKRVKYFKFQSPFFFFNRKLDMLSAVTIQKTFKSYLKQSKINRNLTPSSLRHAYAVNLIRQNTDLNFIRDTLGYKTYEGLLIYKDYFNAFSRSKQDRT